MGPSRDNVLYKLRNLRGGLDGDIFLKPKPLEEASCPDCYNHTDYTHLCTQGRAVAPLGQTEKSPQRQTIDCKVPTAPGNLV